MVRKLISCISKIGVYSCLKIITTEKYLRFDTVYEL